MNHTEKKPFAAGIGPHLAILVAMALGALGAGPVAAQASVANPLRDKVQAHQAQRAAQLGLAAAGAQRGGEIDPEVVGGKPAKDGRWPFMVALVNKNIPSNYDAQFCGASLISPRDVLTAAHCVQGTPPSLIQVLVGTQDLESGGRRVNIQKITVHPNYKRSTSDSDVAVLRLSREVADITPVGYITTLEEEAQFAPTGKKTFGMGWGNTESDPAFPADLHNVKLPVVDRDICNAPDAYDGRITDTMMCAGLAEGGIDTCQGDSGGPLVTRNADKAYHLQVGIVSWGFGCADPNHYGIYSRLATLGAWVSEQVAKP